LVLKIEKSVRIVILWCKERAGAFSPNLFVEWAKLSIILKKSLCDALAVAWLYDAVLFITKLASHALVKALGGDVGKSNS
jgi:hypothetical protein